MRGVKRSAVMFLFVSIPVVSATLITQPPAVNSIPMVPLEGAVSRMPDFPVKEGIASWYSERDPAINRHTASGEVFDDSDWTCASWVYPFGTLLRVTNLENGKSVLVRVNDRGPAKRLGRLIDLTEAAFRRLANPSVGLIRVSVKEVDLEEALLAL